MIKDIYYLACPFTDSDRAVKIYRFEKANQKAAELMSKGWFVYSPITHCWPIAQAGKLPSDWEFWEGLDRTFLSVCKKMLVLCLDGWKESVGVQAEIKIAEELGLPIEYINP